ncbi:unnamed protein product [Sympodiomycopsis kandeliae]
MSAQYHPEDVKFESPSHEDKGDDGYLWKVQPVGEEASISDADAEFAAQIAREQDHDIKERTLGWKKTAALMFGEQVCLAIMAQSWSYSVLGWVGGLLTSFFANVLFYITAMTMWRYIMAHPEGCKDITDIGYRLFGKSVIAREITAFMLLANNILLIGFHILTAAKIFNTLSDHSMCTVAFSAISTIIGIIFSVPRTLNHVSFMSIFSAACMAIAILLFMVFAGIEDHPVLGYQGDYPIAGPVETYAFPKEGTTWVMITNAVLNIVFLMVPQLLFPTFISEMTLPMDFPKSLAALAIASFVLFIVPSAVGFVYLGQYATAPAFGSLKETYKKASFAFVIVPTIIIGAIYSNVSAKYVYKRILKDSHHAYSHTVTGWGLWVGVTAGIWGLGFIFAEVIPSMGDFLSLLGAAFDSCFGYIFWSIAYWHLNKKSLFSSPLRSVNTVVHVIVFFIGLYLLGPGLYSAVKAIITDYSASTRPAFTCANLSL